MKQRYKIKNKKSSKKTKKVKRYRKHGICSITGKQRWYDKETKKYFYEEYEKRGYSDAKKKKAIDFAQEGLGFRAIGRLLGISHTCAYYWVRNFCESLQKQSLPTDCDTIEFDEMWHFCQKKTKKLGSGQQ